MQEINMLQTKESQRIHYGFIIMMIVSFALKDIHALFIDLGYFFGALTIYASRIDFKFINKKTYTTQKYIGLILMIFTAIQLVIHLFELMNA